MSSSQKKQFKGGGGKRKAAEAGHKAKSLQERSLNAWRGLRPALEVGAAEKQRVASMGRIKRRRAQRHGVALRGKERA